MRMPSILAAAAGLVLYAGASEAHPKLVSTSPAPNAVVVKPARLELRFSERLMPKFSGADLMMVGGKGMDHAPMKVAATSAVAADGRTLIVRPRAPLGAGRYSVAWHVVSADTHRIVGNYAFTVK